MSIRDFKPGTEVVNKAKRNNQVYVVSGTGMDMVYCHPPGDRGEGYSWHHSKLKIIRTADGEKVYSD
jgi:hypothetical protein